DLSGSGTLLDLGSGSLATVAGGTIEVGTGPGVVFANDAKLKTTGNLFSLTSGTLKTTTSAALVNVGGTGDPALDVARVLNATGGTLTLVGPLLTVGANTSVSDAAVRATTSFAPGAGTLINVTGAKLSAVKLLDLSGSGTLFDLGSGSLATTAGGILEIGAGTSVVFANDAKLKTTGDLFSLTSGTLKTTTSTALVNVTGSTGDPVVDVARILNASGGTLTLAGPLLTVGVNTSVSNAVLRAATSLTPGASTLINVTGAKLTTAKLLDLSGSGTVLDLGSGSLATAAGGILEVGAGPGVVFANDAKLKTSA